MNHAVEETYDSLIEESSRNVALAKEEAKTKSPISSKSDLSLPSTNLKGQPVLDTLYVGRFRQNHVNDREVVTLFAEKGCPKVIDVIRTLRQSNIVYVKFESKEDAETALKICSKGLEFKGHRLNVYYKLIREGKDRENEKSKSNSGNTRNNDRQKHRASIKPMAYHLTSPWLSGGGPTPLMSSYTSSSTMALPSLMSADPLGSAVPLLGGMVMPSFTSASLSSSLKPRPLMNFDEILTRNSAFPSNLAYSSEFARTKQLDDNVFKLKSSESPMPYDLVQHAAMEMRRSNEDRQRSYMDMDRPSRYQNFADNRVANNNNHATMSRRSRSRSPKQVVKESAKDKRDVTNVNPAKRRFEEKLKTKDDELKSGSISRSTVAYCMTIGERLERMNPRQESYARMKIEEALYEAEFGGLKTSRVRSPGDGDSPKSCYGDHVDDRSGVDGMPSPGAEFRDRLLDAAQSPSIAPETAADWLNMISRR